MLSWLFPWQVGEMKIIEQMEKITTGEECSLGPVAPHRHPAMPICIVDALTHACGDAAPVPASALLPPLLLTAWRPEGEWIARLDLVEQGDKLVVQEMEQVGQARESGGRRRWGTW